MRNVVLFMHLSLDGFCATEKGELDWIPYNNELEKYGERIVKTVGVPLYGRVTYEMMKQYSNVLKDPNVSEHDKKHVEWLENVEKIVFSKTLKKSNWNNTRVISDNITEEIARLNEITITAASRTLVETIKHEEYFRSVHMKISKPINNPQIVDRDYSRKDIDCRDNMGKQNTKREYAPIKYTFGHGNGL